jgi:hypothetical protein
LEVIVEQRYSRYKPLNQWFIDNKDRIRKQYGINLNEDKDEWIIDFAEEVYTYGVAVEYDEMTKHKRG